jgi:aryl-alcohol dehydrogenase-like predicted oxidoreductase
VAGYGNKYLRKNGGQTRITAQQVEESVNGSLERLQTDYIDLLQVRINTVIAKCFWMVCGRHWNALMSCACICVRLQIHWPDRYVPLFGAGAYDIANEREDNIPFEEQLKALDAVIRAGKVCAWSPYASGVSCSLRSMWMHACCCRV